MNKTAPPPHPNDDDDGSRKDLFALIYDDLLARAHRLLEDHATNSLNTTGLVHECWLKLAKANSQSQDKVHFFHLAALAMRQIMVDKARYRQRSKRDQGLVGSLQYHDELAAVDRDSVSVDVLALEQAIEALTQHDKRLVDVVQLRFFAGLELTEIADLLDVSLSTVKRDWNEARAHLYANLSAQRK